MRTSKSYSDWTPQLSIWFVESKIGVAAADEVEKRDILILKGKAEKKQERTSF